MDSILLSIKKMLGLEEAYKHFDQDIKMHINTVFGILTQLGVGPENGYSIEDETNTWDEFITGPNLEMVKSYVYLRVKMLFDPGLSSVTIGAMNEQIAMLEWRINVTVDPGKEV